MPINTIFSEYVIHPEFRLRMTFWKLISIYVKIESIPLDSLSEWINIVFSDIFRNFEIDTTTNTDH